MLMNKWRRICHVHRWAKTGPGAYMCKNARCGSTAHDRFRRS